MSSPKTDFQNSKQKLQAAEARYQAVLKRTSADRADALVGRCEAIVEGHDGDGLTYEQIGAIVGVDASRVFRLAASHRAVNAACNKQGDPDAR
jgi:DNA-directed RNA polymerase specialized sigma24 family protein